MPPQPWEFVAWPRREPHAAHSVPYSEGTITKNRVRWLGTALTDRAMRPTRPYTVKAGDWLAKIAEEHGSTVSEIWNHPDNAELRAKRGSPDVLYPGDIVHIPYDPVESIPPPPITGPPSSKPPITVPPVTVPPITVPPVGVTLPTLGQLGLIIDDDPLQNLDVVDFRGVEKMSACFRFDITALVPLPVFAELEHSLVGRRAAFVFSTAIPRLVRGVVSRVSVSNVPARAGLQPVKVTLVPHLRLLRYRRRSRIFQHLTIAEIAKRVLFEAGIETRTTLTQDHPPRAYCTQYEESDLHFLKRILAEAGIFFTLAEPPFDTPLETLIQQIITGLTGSATPHGASGLFETWSLGDSPIAYPALLDPLTSLVAGGMTARVALLPPELVAANPAIWKFSRASQLRTTAASYREYDPTRPGFELVASARLTPPEGDLRRPAMPHGGGLELEHYEHHGPFMFPDWEHRRNEPARLLMQKRRRADVAKGAGNMPTFSPGRTFILEGHPTDGVNRQYVITKVVHRGRASGLDTGRSYENTFECVPSDVTFCPKRPPRRSVMVALTATVVGPPGEDIHVDPLGQIKVRFHWDRESSGGDSSSCWIRTMQNVAGNAWGTQLIPRVGSEVIVTFEGGDIDKPMVIGSLYNGTHPPPFSLPEERSKSGLRTNTTPGGDSYNELSFEDRAGEQEIYLRASRDLRTEVNNDHVLSIGNSSRIEVEGSQSERIATDRHIEVGKDRELHVRGDETRFVHGSETHTVQHSLNQRVSGDFIRRVEGSTIMYSNGDVSCERFGDATTRTHGHEIRVVGSNNAPKSAYTHVEGRSTLYAADRIELRSASEIALICGQSSIRITPTQIDLFAANVTGGDSESGFSTSAGGMKLKSKAAAMQLSQKGLVATTKDGATVSLAEEIRLDGRQILLNSPAEAEDDPPPEANAPTTIHVVDQAGRPVPHQHVVLRLGDGAEVPATLDEEGRVTLDLPEEDDDVTVVFPSLHQVGGM